MSIQIQTDAERMTAELNAHGTITFNDLSYDIYDGHFYIDGRYGYSSDQRICEDNSAGKCLGITY